jgi:cell division transport system permease protein
VAITAFFPDSTSQEKADKTRASVESYPEVESVTYVSKEEALDRFKKNLSDQPDVANGITKDVLPASLEIKLKDPSDSEAVTKKLVDNEGFAQQDLSYPQQTIDRLNQVKTYVVWALRVATALFIAASALLIFNTIRLSIYARRKEIEVMKLVGASDEFVRTPFILEGLVQGLIGATLAAILVVGVNWAFVSWAQKELPFFGISADAVNAPLMFVVLVCVGAVVGVLGSFLSIRRFLKV